LEFESVSRPQASKLESLTQRAVPSIVCEWHTKLMYCHSKQWECIQQARVRDRTASWA
jgi:hypothetical protein